MYRELEGGMASAVARDRGSGGGGKGVGLTVLWYFIRQFILYSVDITATYITSEGWGCRYFIAVATWLPLCN